MIEDVFKEADESFYLSLTNATGAKLGSYLNGNAKILAKTELVAGLVVPDAETPSQRLVSGSLKTDVSC